MAISLYICRAETPARASETPISLAEWKLLVRDIPEMHLYEGAESLPDYIEAPSAGDGLARWSGHPRADVIWFYYQNGAIEVRGYDAYVMMRMRMIATRLQARVIDVDGRYF